MSLSLKGFGYCGSHCWAGGPMTDIAKMTFLAEFSAVGGVQTGVHLPSVITPSCFSSLNEQGRGCEMENFDQGQS